ncbi:hypothetical protein [Paenibacillus lactis]|uniref:hypothetical protein n=1 Tax=Paenibacillus lactis TaxID=228574 RepID=UPI0004AF4305
MIIVQQPSFHEVPVQRITYLQSQLYGVSTRDSQLGRCGVISRESAWIAIVRAFIHDFDNGDPLTAGRKWETFNDMNKIYHGAMTGFLITMKKRRKGSDIKTL